MGDADVTVDIEQIEDAVVVGEDEVLVLDLKDSYQLTEEADIQVIKEDIANGSILDPEQVVFLEGFEVESMPEGHAP